jgi:hypothetical protein
MYAGRVALLLWRLRRLARNQSALADHIERGVDLSAPKSPHWKQRIAADPNFPTNLESGRKRLNLIRRDLSTLQKFIATPDDQRQTSNIEPDTAVSLITHAAQQNCCYNRITEMLMAGSYPGLGPMSPERAQLPTIYRWTAAMLADAFAMIASWSQRQPQDLIARLEYGIREAQRNYHSAQIRAGQELARQRQVGPLRRLKPLTSAQRYESAIERSLLRTLNQLLLIQATRPPLPADSSTTPPQPPLNTHPTPPPDLTQTP